MDLLVGPTILKTPGSSRYQIQLSPNTTNMKPREKV